MEAAKIIDVFGSQPGYSKQQADARQAYTQALFTGIETWVMDTALVARECWLFRTRSEGICTRDTVPGSAILYIRDTRTDEMLYSAQAGDTKQEDQD